MTTDSRGAKHDAGKPRMNLIPPSALLDIGDVLTYGAHKYAPDAWRTIDNPEPRYLAAALRHILGHMRGEVRDNESGLPALAHAATSLMFILEIQQDD